VPTEERKNEEGRKEERRKEERRKKKGRRPVDVDDQTSDYCATAVEGGSERATCK
jgi:hypothetical protein